MKIDISQELLSATVEAMRDLESRYEAEAIAFSVIACPDAQQRAIERAESASVARGLFNFFAGL